MLSQWPGCPYWANEPMHAGLTFLWEVQGSVPKWGYNFRNVSLTSRDSLSHTASCPSSSPSWSPKSRGPVKITKWGAQLLNANGRKRGQCFHIPHKHRAARNAWVTKGWQWLLPGPLLKWRRMQQEPKTMDVLTRKRFCLLISKEIL